MTTKSFIELAQAVVAAYSGRHPAFATRVQFWINQFGDRDILSLTTDDIEDGIDALVRRGKLKVITVRGISSTVPTDRPLSNSSVNRHVSALGTVFKELRRPRLLPRGFSNPMRGVGRQPEGDGAR